MFLDKIFNKGFDRRQEGGREGHESLAPTDYFTSECVDRLSQTFGKVVQVNKIERIK
ncbi:MAG: hypothetical protein AAB606_04230 [Patescibacteria group bacterium]